MFLAAPLYIFWGRSFMIETTALFFAMSYSGLVVRFLQCGRVISFLGAAMTGCLAVLTKATTLPAFSVVATIGFLWLTLRWRATGMLRTKALKVGLGAAILILPYPVGFGWVAYRDMLIKNNPVGQMLTSEALTAWNYGSPQMRLSEVLWVDTLLQRILPDTLGYVAAALFFLMLCTQIFPFFNLKLSSRSVYFVAASAIAFFIPLVIFTNLHVVHNYYQVANSVFLILMVAFIVYDLRERNHEPWALTVVIIVVASQISTFYKDYYRGTVSPPQSDHYEIAILAKALTPENSALYVFGVDWNSLVPYYAERRAFVAPNWLSPVFFAQLTASPEHTLGGVELGGIVWCRYNDVAFSNEIERLIEGMNEVGRVGSCSLYVSV
jgi:hypothetical protein